MTTWRKVFFLFTLLLLSAPLSGCLTTAPGPKFSKPVAPESGKAVIYVYRARVAMTGHEIPGVKMNDSEIVKALPELTYFPVSVTPGDYEFTPKLFGIYKTTPAHLNVKAGQTYFVQMRMTMGHIQFQQLDRDEAMAYMATCYRLNPDYAKDSRVLTNTTSVAPDTAPAVATVPTPPAPTAEKQPAEPVSTPSPETATAEPQNPETAVAAVSETKLFVETVPADARIRIMNIRPKFHQGITLDAGRYKIDVSAPGYQTFVEWISLEQGEVKTMEVALLAKEPEKAKAEPVKTAITEAPAQKAEMKSQQTTSIPSPPADLSPEEKHYSELLASSSAVDIRNAAKNIYYRYSDSAYLATVAEQCLLKNYNSNIRDNTHIDAMAWLCKALANTHDNRFRATLKTVAENAGNRKLKRYADKSLSAL